MKDVFDYLWRQAAADYPELLKDEWNSYRVPQCMAEYWDVTFDADAKKAVVDTHDIGPKDSWNSEQFRAKAAEVASLYFDFHVACLTEAARKLMEVAAESDIVAERLIIPRWFFRHLKPSLRYLYGLPLYANETTKIVRLESPTYKWFDTVTLTDADPTIELL